MERKSITNTARLILCVWNIGLFVAVWFLYYNQYVFNRYWFYGAMGSCLAYAIIYLAFCRLYKAFRIASAHISDTLFGQTISFGIADVILYVECCLINNHYVNIFPGVCVAVLQIFGSMCIITITKRYFIHHVEPKPTLLIYGKRSTKEAAEVFAKHLLAKYAHLFRIAYVEQEDMKKEQLLEYMEDCKVVLLYEVSDGKRSSFMKVCTELHKNFYFTPQIEDIFCQGSSLKNLLDTPLMKYDYTYESPGGYVGKRAFDLLFSVFCLIVLFPILLVTAICIKAEDHGPVIYKQKRCTKDGRVFEILKFRSMIVDAEKEGILPCKGNDSRITRVGRVIRAVRIDELPQIVNILKGDMSFVGPRPERIEHVEQYTGEMPEFAYRLRVKGGLTGYAQIFGKYNTSAYDKLRLDLMYIENQSFFLDLKILMMTFKTIFKAESTEGFETEKSNEMNQKAKAQTLHVVQHHSKKDLGLERLAK